MKLALGIPHRGEIKVRTMLSTICAMNALESSTHIVTMAQNGAFVHWTRNDCAKYALEQNCSHLLMIDTDMVFPADTFLKLLALDKAIVGVLSFKKEFPKTPTVHFLDDDNRYKTCRPGQIPDEPFKQIDGKRIAVGAGIMLIKLAAIDMPPPAPGNAWFEARYGGPGEDVYFSHLASLHGAEVWCDPTIDVRHLGDYEY